MNTLAERFESLMGNFRFRVVGAALMGVLLSVSMGLLAASRRPVRPLVVGPVLPEKTLSVPMIRYSPYPEVRVLELRALFPAPMARVKVGPTQGGRARTMLSRR
jgi:hypothetical protein